jgi:hypothetical protein
MRVDKEWRRGCKRARKTAPKALACGGCIMPGPCGASDVLDKPTHRRPSPAPVFELRRRRPPCPTRTEKSNLVPYLISKSREFRGTRRLPTQPTNNFFQPNKAHLHTAQFPSAAASRDEIPFLSSHFHPTSLGFKITIPTGDDMSVSLHHKARFLTETSDAAFVPGPGNPKQHLFWFINNSYVRPPPLHNQTFCCQYGSFIISISCSLVPAPARNNSKNVGRDPNV